MHPRGKRLALLVAALAVVVLGVAAWRAWPHLRFRWLFESLGPNAQGLPEYRHRQTGITLVGVPGGTFLMGAQAIDPKGPNYDPGFYSKPEARDPDPLACSGSDERVIRGGCWGDDCDFFCRSALRAPGRRGIGSLGLRAAYWPLP